LLGGAANGAEEGDWRYRDWASENTALGDVAVDFLPDLERESEQQAVIIFVRAHLKGMVVM